MRHTLEFTGDRAEHYTAATEGATEPSGPRQELERSLLFEFQDTPEVRESSTAWGELRASAIFGPDLRADLVRASLTWVHDVAALPARVCPDVPAPVLTTSAERLTALLEGLSTRRLGVTLTSPHAREPLRETPSAEISHLQTR
ncbi:TetR family transcriptional regulator C-terminal domain-containing protein [Streptomyces sp. NPDC003863]